MPEEISLVGYDDIFFSEILDVPLTTVSQPVYDMGVEAVQQLISAIGSGVNSQKCITFQPRLVVRESTQITQNKISLTFVLYMEYNNDTNRLQSYQTEKS